MMPPSKANPAAVEKMRELHAKAIASDGMLSAWSVAFHKAVRADLPALLSDHDRLAEENGRLREALKPLAAIADIYDDREDGHHQVWVDATEREVKALTVDVCRKARRALSEE
jgi:hypothetical protein